MIDEKELMIGNWVEHNEKWCYRREGDEENIFQFQWDDSDWARLAESLIFLEDISPIPLTTEMEEDYLKNKADWVYRAFINNKPEYVHQLQNFHFIITGKELGIEL